MGMTFTLTERQQQNLWRRVDRSGECWTWTGVTKNGYGHYCGWDASARRKVNLMAHRAVWTLLRGDIPQGLQLDHLCRNRLCVNPEHLEPVTQVENVRRGASPSADNARKTICMRGHALEGENLYVTPGRGYRQCRECVRLRWLRFAERRRAGEAPPRRLR
jgi:hypothetical protein